MYQERINPEDEMTSTISMTTIKDILDSKGYKVFFGPPEKAMDGQVHIEIYDMLLEVETPVIYHIHTGVSLGVSTSKPELLTALIVKLILDVENQLYIDETLNRGTFKFTTITFSKPGELYNVAIKCDFFESIQITV
jgi:hypothetical protein